MQKVSKSHQGFNNPLMLAPIETLCLPEKKTNALMLSGIFYIGQVVASTREELIKIPHINIKTLNQIIDAISLRYDGSVFRGYEEACPSFLSVKDKDLAFELMKEYYCISDDDCRDELSINLALPAADIEALGDDKLIEIVTPNCEWAFHDAVNMMMDCRSPELSPEAIQRYTLDRMEISDESKNAAIQDMACTELRTVRIPIQIGEAMSQMLSKEFLRSVAGKLGGATLYPALKPIIDESMPKAVLE